MKRMLALILSRLRRKTSAAAAPSSEQTAAFAQHAAARAIAQALDAAMRHGQLEHAQRLADDARRLAQNHPVLAERLARLSLLTADAASALDLIEACSTRTSSLRLLRIVCLLQLGRRAEAHMDLQEWAGRSSAPLHARLLLGLLEWFAGDIDAAVQALLRNLKQLEDPHSLMALALIAAAQGAPQQAAWWASRLREQALRSHDLPDLDFMLRSIGERGGEAIAAEPSAEHVCTLATELLANEETIPALAAAQERVSQPGAARLLCDAIRTALPELESPAAGCEALARLWMTLDDRKQALHWARRGLAHHSMSASLARLVQQLQQDDGEPLQRVPQTMGSIGSKTMGVAA